MLLWRNKRGENKNGRYENQIINYQLFKRQQQWRKKRTPDNPEKNTNFSLDNFQ